MKAAPGKARKTGSHGKLANLPRAQVETVAAWLLDEGLSYARVVARVKEEFGLAVVPATVQRFWQRECVPRKLQRSSLAASTVQAMAGTLGVDWQQANAQLIGQRIFEMLADPKTDIKAVSALGAVLEKVKTRDLHGRALEARIAAERARFEQKERQMALDREKFEFDAAEAVLREAARIKTISADRALSSDEKREQLRRLLFPQAFIDTPA